MVSTCPVVDGQLLEISRMPTKWQIRRNDVTWNYDLLEGAHTVTLKAQNIQEVDGIYYKNSQKYTGKYVTYFDNGNTRQEIEIRNGEKHGKIRIYFENGQLNEIRSYKHNQMDGKWAMYNDHGIKTSVARYKNGEKDGKWMIWNDYGNLLYELHYHSGKKTGIWKKYDEQGNLINKREY